MQRSVTDLLHRQQFTNENDPAVGLFNGNPIVE